MVQFSLNAGKKCGSTCARVALRASVLCLKRIFQRHSRTWANISMEIGMCQSFKQKIFSYSNLHEFLHHFVMNRVLAYKEFQCAPLFQFVRFFLFGAPSFLHTGWKKVSTKCSGKGKYRSWAAFFASLNENTNDKHDLVKWYTVSSWNRNGKNINGIDRRRELFCKIYHCKMKRWEK